MSMRLKLLAAVLAGSALAPPEALATPQFARRYAVDCSHCHSAPPRLNERGLRFLASGYQLDGRSWEAATLPMAVWNTIDVEGRHSAGLLKAFPSRVEIISAGPVGRTGAAFFIEWRALSQNVGGNGQLVNRSGRFEDLFIRLPLAAGGALSLTAGQFRTMTQVDVSQRLGLSEPLIFSSGVPGRRASDARLTGLRGFSASGREPALRLDYHASRGGSSADGWFAAVALPLTGELSVPLADAASFELEARPKGVFLEAYRRKGLATIGGHVFLGDARRRVATLVVTQAVGDRVILLGGLGAFNAAGATDARLSLGAEATLTSLVVGGLRLDHRTGPGQDPALLVYANGHLPFGPAGLRQALRLQIEHRVQPANHATTAALSHVF